MKNIIIFLLVAIFAAFAFASDDVRISQTSYISLDRLN
jgi:hypothetical protein